MAEKLKVGVFMGGMSSEREVSLNSGRNVHDNLDPEFYEGKPVFLDERSRFWVLPWQLVSQNTTVDIFERLEHDARRIAYEDLRKEIDFAFLCLHGKFGEDGCVQGLLELLGIPFTGPGVLASAIGMNKEVQQKILKAAGLDVPESVVIEERRWRQDAAGIRKQLAGRFGGRPLVTKPIREGSSVGVTIVRDADSLDRGLAEAFRWDTAALAEEYLEGIEFSCIVLEEDGSPRPLDLTEIHPQSEYYTYDDKYMPGRCRKFTPPKGISAEQVARIKEHVVRAFVALGFRSYGRIDGFLLKDGRILVTDPNSSSGMAPSSFFFEQAACAGMLPSMVISRLIENALAIHRGKRGPL
ncbi:MAG: D-alanine--D-alanine ligase [Syntrophaceae bacterium PtaU1.Bin231]|nr:MAG: D-alanine--D-alanine ligase [Syntrophaceae bacterium PtaU1.Bin231]